MTVYLDTSAIVPLVVAEPTSRLCREVWLAADRVATSRLAYVEAAAALASAHRRARLTTTDVGEARDRLDRLWRMIDVVEFDAALMDAAASASATFALRGYDAVHCASALRIADVRTVAVSGDRALLDAWHKAGLATIDTNSTALGHRR
ncbi:type II toxin-antitoxin system VapC family toxin [Microbacterium luticocti]|uniref:type II toxin-antitoxin system VapC family toxin n=1 Tax=Microbacterium luticocti TaxID=451764 RepID=UPI000413D865|nr:type II toxin-antitoxin system VapC family toxin [Microbacterium luticocti]